MSRQATDFEESVQGGVPSPLLPADHVLQSAAVLFPGAFDQHGSPLIVFPADEQAKLSSELSKAEVVDFINYFLCLHNKRQDKESLVSVVADLRHASLHTTRVIAETLLLLEVHKRTVHSVYIIQPKKKNVVKLLLKILFPPKSYTASFKKVFLKEISELSNYIDRSQLMPSLGGYLLFCHHSWVAFIKDIEEFAQKFLSVVQRLPSCISSLQALSRLPLPSTFSELQHFCSTNEAKFQQLRRELGLDDLLHHCESMVDKLRYPEKEPYYQAMVGTALFSHTALDMLQNHSRITAAVEKVELLWQQAFSKAHLQLQVLQLREHALQITEQIKTLLQEKLQPYKIEVSKDAAKAVLLVSQFEESIHTPAMALIRCAEDVIFTVAEILLVDGQTKEHWVLDLERLKEKVHSAVHFILQTLRAVSSYHHYYNKANSWYSLVLCENVLQVMLSGLSGGEVSMQRNWGTIPAWRYKISPFLKKNPPPDVEELVHLAHLSNVIPDDELQVVGKQMAQRCMTLRKLLTCSGPVAVGHLQLALQWQFEMFRSSHGHHSADRATDRSAPDAQDLGKCESGKEAAHLLRTSRSAVRGTVSAEGKPSSLSSFDSGFDGAGTTWSWGGREAVQDLYALAGTRDSVRPAMSTPQIHKENISSVSDCDGSVGRASIQIIPKVTVDSLNVEIKVKRSAALPSNPWLSLPVDDLENSYTVTITQNPTPQKTDLPSLDPSDPYTKTDHSTQSKDQQTQTTLSTAQPRGPQFTEWTLHSGSSLEDPELSPIRNVLSSTITEGRDKSICTTQGIPTLLWDSYDLHDQDPEADDGGIDISLNDWDVKEQEGLREVEKILDRADEILEKEEHVLAQEAVLDTLLRSEDHYDQWPPWDREEYLIAMSSSELAEAGVLGLEDYLDTAEFDHLTEPRPRSTSDTKASEDDRQGTEAADRAAFHSRPDLLKELRKVHVLDELIMEENLKICKLQSCNENPEEELCVGELPGLNVLSCMSKEREALRSQLEKEKKEVEKLEKSLCHEHTNKHRPRKVVKCSIMEKASSENKADQVLCDELLLDSCSRSQRAHSAPLVQSDSHSQDACETESIPEVSVTPAISHKLVFNTDVTECSSSSNNNSNNNNNHVSLEHLSEITPEGERETVLPACSDLYPAEEIQASSPADEQSTAPQLAPEQPLEFDPGGRHEYYEDLPDGAMRILDSAPIGIQTQSNIIMREITDFKTPIVLDTGSGLMKAGFSDQNLPNVIFPTIIGMPKYEEVMNDNLEKETYIGHVAQHMRGVLALKHPIKNGVIHNWDDMEKIWHHTFQQLCVDADDHPVLLTEAAMNPLENRQRMVELMFECFSVPFTYVAMQPVLALYAAGRSTGVVFDSGDGVSHSVPVFEGYCLAHGVQCFPLAGVDVTLHLKKLLQEQGVCMRTTAEVEIVRDMKERCCCVALDYEAELSQGGSSCKQMHYTMPDGQIVTLGTERFRAPEILFKPELIGRDHYGMHETIFKSIFSSDIDLRRCFLGNIILSGGNTLLPGLPERLQAEIKGLVPANSRYTVRVASPEDRDFSVWRGGAVLANLPTFSSAWISRDEYDEYGPNIIFRKCF